MKSLTEKTAILVLTMMLFVYQDISYANNAPEFDDGDSTTIWVLNNSPEGRTVDSISATDADDDTLTYSLSGTDAASFTIANVTIHDGTIDIGRIKVGAGIDYTNAPFSVTVTVSDGNGGLDSIDVTIEVNNAPVFDAGETATRSVAEDVPKGTLLGEPLTATDEDDDTLTYVIAPIGLSFAEYIFTLARFDIDTSTGQLKTFSNDLQLNAGISVEFTVAVVDRKGGQDLIDVTINVINDTSDDNNGAAPSNRLLDSLLDQENLKTLDSETLRTYLSVLQLESDGSAKYQRAITLIGGILEETRPKQTLLFANYPNPFNPETWIPYQLANASDVQITIYDSRGTVVRQLELGYQLDGYYTSRSRAAYWDGRNDTGESVASGIYFYQLQTDKASPLRKMLILK